MDELRLRMPVVNACCGRPDGDKRFALWARSAEGALAMQATAEIA